MAKHDLEVINAALALGDPAWPPPGTVVRYILNGFTYVAVLETTHSGIEAMDHVFYRIDEPADKYNKWIIRPRDMVVLSVPKDAPPFSEWPRR